MGGLLFGYISDNYGRIPALIGCNLFGGLAGMATVFVQNFWQFALCRFFVGFAFDGAFAMMYILGEYTGGPCLEIPFFLFQSLNMLDPNGEHSSQICHWEFSLPELRLHCHGLRTSFRIGNFSH